MGCQPTQLELQIAPDARGTCESVLGCEILVSTPHTHLRSFAAIRRIGNNACSNHEVPPYDSQINPSPEERPPRDDAHPAGRRRRGCAAAGYRVGLGQNE